MARSYREQRYEILDRVTGEVARPRRRRKEFTKLMTAAPGLLDDLLIHGTGTEIAVFLHLARAVPYRDCFDVNQSELARTLHRNQSSISRAVAALLGRGLLCRDHDEPSCYWLNPTVAYRGDILDHGIAHRRACCAKRKR